MKLNQISLAALLIITLFSACKKKEVKKELPPQSVTVTKVLQQNVPLYNEFVGQIFGLKDIPIRSRVEGFLETINFQEGTNVKKDQLLYTVDDQPFQADVTTHEGLLTEAKTRLIQAENDLERIKPLAEVSAVSQSDLDAAIADRDAAKASVNAAKANLELSKIQLSYCKIYSPINGVIGRTKAREGEFVGKDPNPVILNTVSRLETVRVQFSLTESDYLGLMRELEQRKTRVDKVRSNDDSKPYLELILADGSTHTHKGIIDFIDREVNATTGSIMIQASFQNPGSILRPGQFAKIKAKVELVENAILVPQKAVAELQGKHIVTVLQKDNKIEKRTVKVGAKYCDYWIINSGIKSTDQIIYEGFQKVRNDMIVTPIFKDFESQTNVLESK